METLKAGAAAVADGVSSLASGITGTDASKQDQIHQEGIDYIKDQVNNTSTSQPANTAQEQQIHKEGTDYIKEQVQNRGPESANAGQRDESLATATTRDKDMPPTTYLPGQNEYSLPGPPGGSVHDPAKSNAGLSFKHPSEELEGISAVSNGSKRNSALDDALEEADVPRKDRLGDDVETANAGNDEHKASEEQHENHEKDQYYQGKESVREHLDHQSGMKSENPGSIPTAGGQKLGAKHWGESQKIN